MRGYLTRIGYTVREGHSMRSDILYGFLTCPRPKILID